MRKTISRLCNVASAPVAAIQDAITERLESVCETASLLYNRVMENIGYTRERLEDIVEKEGEEEAKEQQQKEEEVPAAAK